MFILSKLDPWTSGAWDMALSDSAARASTGGNAGVYVYSIIASTQPVTLGPIGIGGRGDVVRSIQCGDLAALVSDAPLTAFDPTEENVLAHERVNALALERFTVLPLAFGSVFRSEADIADIVMKAHDSIASALSALEGRVEFNLRATWNSADALRMLEEQAPALGQIRERLEGATYFEQVEIGRHIAEALDRLAQVFVQDILAALEGVTAAVQLNDPIGQDMILNAAFLVDRTQEPAFQTAVDELANRHARLFFRLSGPWPAYNFVRIHLKVQEGGGR